MESVSKTQRLEQEVQYQNNHLQQAFDKLESYFDIELDENQRDCIKVIVVKSILLAETTQDLNHHKLLQAQEKMDNEKFWNKMSKN